LFAKQNEGSFILRIEDTDAERSDEAMVDGILGGLKWLGLDWNEGPYFQSERSLIYSRAVERLLAEGKAFKDFSPPGKNSAAHLTESPDLANTDSPYAVRFRVPKDQRVSFEDLVFGRITVDSEQIEDFVILRSNGSPTYHLSVVVDDIEMTVSHVIRGADHLSNTSKHVLLYQALGQTVPVFCHLPLILGTDKKRLSKRHGAASVVEYSQQGFLPEAVRNYLALLGWSPEGDDEILRGMALVNRFDLSRINKANAIFDVSKLRWMNKRYLSSEPASDLAPRVRNRLRTHGLWRPAWDGEDRAWFLGVVDLLKSRVEDLNDFAAYGQPFFADEFEYEAGAVEKFLKLENQIAEKNLKKALFELRNDYGQLEPFDLKTTEAVLRSLAERYELKTGTFIGAVRLALTGRSKAPGIFDVVVTLGKEKTIERLDRLIRFYE
jgi:glutamyl-tRNA synthetase